MIVLVELIENYDTHGIVVYNNDRWLVKLEWMQHINGSLYYIESAHLIVRG